MKLRNQSCQLILGHYNQIANATYKGINSKAWNFISKAGDFISKAWNFYLNV